MNAGSQLCYASKSDSSKLLDEIAPKSITPLCLADMPRCERVDRDILDIASLDRKTDASRTAVSAVSSESADSSLLDKLSGLNPDYDEIKNRDSEDRQILGFIDGCCQGVDFAFDSERILMENLPTAAYLTNLCNLNNEWGAGTRPNLNLENCFGVGNLGISPIPSVDRSSTGGVMENGYLKRNFEDDSCVRREDRSISNLNSEDRSRRNVFSLDFITRTDRNHFISASEKELISDTVVGKRQLETGTHLEKETVETKGSKLRRKSLPPEQSAVEAGAVKSECFDEEEFPQSSNIEKLHHSSAFKPLIEGMDHGAVESSSLTLNKELCPVETKKNEFRVEIKGNDCRVEADEKDAPVQVDESVLEMSLRSEDGGCGRVSLVELNPYLLCSLCSGYMVDATTITECLHSFCRSCIVKYLESSKYCPICDVMVHKTKPQLYIKQDKTLQTLICKLVPGIFNDEMRRRKEFYASKPELDPGIKGHVTSRSEVEGMVRECRTDLPPFKKDEYFSTCLELSDRLPPFVSESESGLKYLESTDTKVKDQRHLLCPAIITIGHLKRFLRGKFNLSPNLNVDIYHSNAVLKDVYSLYEIAQIYTWRRIEPLKLYYVVYDRVDPATTPLLHLATSVSTNRTFADNITSKPAKKSHKKQQPLEGEEYRGSADASSMNQHFRSRGEGANLKHCSSKSATERYNKRPRDTVVDCERPYAKMRKIVNVACCRKFDKSKRSKVLFNKKPDGYKFDSSPDKDSSSDDSKYSTILNGKHNDRKKATNIETPDKQACLMNSTDCSVGASPEKFASSNQWGNRKERSTSEAKRKWFKPKEGFASLPIKGPPDAKKSKSSFADSVSEASHGTKKDAYPLPKTKPKLISASSDSGEKMMHNEADAGEKTISCIDAIVSRNKTIPELNTVYQDSVTEKMQALVARLPKVEKCKGFDKGLFDSLAVSLEPSCGFLTSEEVTGNALLPLVEPENSCVTDYDNTTLSLNSRSSHALTLDHDTRFGVNKKSLAGNAAPRMEILNEISDNFASAKPSAVTVAAAVEIPSGILSAEKPGFEPELVAPCEVNGGQEKVAKKVEISRKVEVTRKAEAVRRNEVMLLLDSDCNGRSRCKRPLRNGPGQLRQRRSALPLPLANR